VFGRTLSRRVYPETSPVGDCFGSLGPATFEVANPGEAESVPVDTTPKLEGARESDRPTGHNPAELFTNGTQARGSVCSAPSLRSICLRKRSSGHELGSTSFYSFFFKRDSFSSMNWRI
jgi:hypothetical protein